MSMLKLIYLVKVRGKIFYLLNPKCYLSWLEVIARHATTPSPVLSKVSEQLLSYKLLSRTTKV